MNSDLKAMRDMLEQDAWVPYNVDYWKAADDPNRTDVALFVGFDETDIPQIAYIAYGPEAQINSFFDTPELDFEDVVTHEAVQKYGDELTRIEE